MTKDPICGMTVDQATVLHAERDGQTFFFGRELSHVDHETGGAARQLRPWFP